MPLVLVGLSHHSAPIAVRERLNCPEHQLPEALRALRACPGVQDGLLLSTCNRMEAYAFAETGDTAGLYAALSRHLAAFHQVPEAAFAPFLYRKAEQDVVQHLFRVAAGLDSLVLGEAQILGQARQALRAAQETGSVGSILTGLFQQAITSSRRVQNETGLGKGAFSIGHAAVDLASRIFSDLSHASILILGAGKMSELTAKHLVDSGVRFVMVANRTFEKAVTLAERLGGKAIHYDTFPDALTTADIVISSTAAPHPILKRETILPVVRKRRGKPLFLIDIAVPRDIAPDVYDLDNVFLYNIDDLQAVVAEEAKGRAEEARRAERIVEEETAKFMGWFRAREAAPVITQLRARLEEIRQGDMALLRAKLGHLSERDWQAIETATTAMINRVGREPVLRLKRETEGKAAETETPHYDLFTATREIFGLHTEETAAKEVETESGDDAVFSGERPVLEVRK